MRTRLVFFVSGMALLIGSLLSIDPAHAVSSNYKDVCTSGCAYSSVQTAIDSITDSSATNVYTVFIDSGVLSTSTSITTNGKSYINFVGRGIGVSVIRATAAWFQNNQTPTDVNLLDLTNSTNITLRGLTIDARTGDPCPGGGGCFGPNTSYAGVKTNLANRVLVQDTEILGITYGLWENDNTAGNLIQVMNSKILASNYAIGTHNATWHIFSSDIRAVSDGGTSGSIAVAFAINTGNSTTVENVTIWGSHLHAESGEAAKSYNVAAVNFPPAPGSQLTVIGSTMHVKMKTADIGSASRIMTAFLLTSPCTGTSPQSRVNVVGSEFLYESPASLSQGRLAGLAWNMANRCVKVDVAGGTFIDNGGSGGSYRADIIGQPHIIGNYEPIINTYGTRLSKIQDTSATPLVLGTGTLSNTSNTQSGKATFAGSNTVVVTLPNPMLDTSYRVTATANVQETIYVSARTTTTFTLKSSNASSTASVDWVLMR